LTSKAQKHESDERNGKQNTHGMIAATTKMLDIRCLRELAEVELDLPAPLGG
jgi:hypothetical protein